MFAQPLFTRQSLAKLGLSILIAGFVSYETDASSKRHETINKTPVEFARVFYIITGKNAAYSECLKSVSKGELSNFDCARPLSDMRSFAPGFDYDSRSLTDPYTACRVLEALSHIYNGENPDGPTRCNE